MLQRGIFFFILFFYFNVLDAKVLKINDVTADIGLSDDFVLCLLQDSYGYIWIGTYNGLNRFDGTNLVTYRYDSNDSTSISSSFIQSIFEDKAGNLWVGTSGGGLCRYNHKSDVFTRYKHLNSNPNSISSNTVVSIGQDSQERIWVATSSGLDFLDSTLTKFIHFKLELEIDVLESMITVMHIDSKDNVWLGTRSDGLIKIDAEDKSTKRYTYRKGDSLSLANDVVRSICEDEQGNIWIASVSGEISKFDFARNHFIRWSDTWDDNYDFSFKNISSIVIDKSQSLWIGTNDGLLYRSSILTQTKPQLFNIDEKREFTEIRSMIIDNHQNIWVATNGQGVYYFKPEGISVQSYNRTNHPEMTHNVVTSIEETSDTKLWLGTNGGGLFYLDRQKDLIIQALPKDIVKYITDLEKDENGNLWISTWGQGLLFFNPTENTTKWYVHDEYRLSSLSLNMLKGIYYDKERNWVWIATHGGGINILDIKTGIVHNNFKNDIVKINLNRPRWGYDIYKDSQGIVWILSVNGIFMIDGDQQIEFSEEMTGHNRIPSNFVVDCFETAKGEFFIATREGLLQFDRWKKLFFPLSRECKDLTDIDNILIDNNKALWLSTKKGIVRCLPDSNLVSFYDESDGFQGKSFFERSNLITSRGEFVFGGLNGVNIFFPDSILRTNEFPKVYFTEMEIAYSENSSSGETSRKNILTDTSIELPYDKSVITIEFSAIEFDFPKKIQYKYRMIGYSETWIDAQNNIHAIFTNLNPGKYLFQVKSTNVNGVWNEEYIQLELNILPPWYMKIWVKILLVLLLSGSVFSFIWYRISSVERERKKLDEMVKKRTSELSFANGELTVQKEKEINFSNEIMKLTEHVLDQNQLLEDQKNQLEELNYTKNKFFSIIAHDLKNPLNGLIGFSELLSTNYKDFNDEQKKHFSELIHQSSVKLYDLLVNLLNWAKTQSGSMSYQFDNVKLSSVLDGIVKLIRPNADKKNQSFFIDCPKELIVYADVNMLSAILRNLLLNSIKYTPNKGLITVTAGKTDKGVRIILSDTGVGMSKEQLDSLFQIDKYISTPGTDNEKGTGLGLIICSEFIKIHNGTMKVESQIDKGTSFTLFFPKKD